MCIELLAHFSRKLRVSLTQKIHQVIYTFLAQYFCLSCMASLLL